MLCRQRFARFRRLGERRPKATVDLGRRQPGARAQIGYVGSGQPAAGRKVARGVSPPTHGRQRIPFCCRDVFTLRAHQFLHVPDTAYEARQLSRIRRQLMIPEIGLLFIQRKMLLDDARAGRDGEGRSFDAKRMVGITDRLAEACKGGKGRKIRIRRRRRVADDTVKKRNTGVG